MSAYRDNDRRDIPRTDVRPSWWYRTRKARRWWAGKAKWQALMILQLACVVIYCISDLPLASFFMGVALALSIGASPERTR